MNKSMNQERILSASFDKILNYIRENDDEQNVVNYHTPASLQQILMPKVDEEPTGEDEFLKMMDHYLEFAVKTGNKQFLNQLYSGFNLPAFIGDMLTTLTNTSMYTYEVAPAATIIEKEMIALMNSYAGYSDGDGIFLTGGSNGNLVAMFTARNRMLPESRFHGYDRTENLVAFINEQAHYSFETAANILGIGAKNVIKVKADHNGRMIPHELEKAIENAKNNRQTPFFVAATCATTLLGAYDPIDEIAEITQKHGLWLHADGAFGGSIILSDQHRYLMKGIEKTDSFVWNPHKLMNIPLVCSALLVKQKGVLQHNITDLNTDYIFHDMEEVEDLGKKSIQCGRHVDAVKLWFAWKYFGKKGYSQRIDNLIEMATYAENIVNQHPRLELMASRQSFSVCFRYQPENVVDLNEFNLAVRENIRKTGQSIVNYGYIGKDLTIRLVMANGELRKKDIDKFFQNFLGAAENLELQKVEEYEYEK
ncbi:MAG: PLP-dependent decarboxylase [Bacteroidales bacterium]|nr:PLP-dependent decarboxylase [Bacteroidales bacterium]